MANKFTPEDIQMYRLMRTSPIYFIEKAWGMIPQPCKMEYRSRLNEIAKLTGDDWEEQKHEIKAEWFGDFDETTKRWKWLEFKKGKNLTWQQYVICLSVEKANAGTASPHISVVSGRGIGKSRTLAMLILWFLFCHLDSQVPCTAPTSDQMYDVLWKELNICIQMLPDKLKKFFVWESQYIRIAESPQTWFARAKTSSKENPEALSGIHADHVMAAIDEASGVFEQIFIAAQGILTSPHIIFLMISQGSRSNGFFYDSHHRNRRMYQTLSFSSDQSPIVDDQFMDSMEKYSIDSDEYRTNVSGLFPKEGSLDSKNYVGLLTSHDVRVIPSSDEIYQPDLILGIDPSGEGTDETTFVIRDRFIMELVATERISTPKSIARIAVTLATKFKIPPENIIIDSFGVGADVAKEIALMTGWDVQTINVGDMCDEEEMDEFNYEPILKRDLYLNKRSEMYWSMKKWYERGGQLVMNKRFQEELLAIRFKRTIKGKIQIMSKEEMRKNGIKSPNCADAGALTFLVDPVNPMARDRRNTNFYDGEEFDPHAVV